MNEGRSKAEGRGGRRPSSRFGLLVLCFRALACGFLGLSGPCRAGDLLLDWEDRPQGDRTAAFRLFLPEAAHPARVVVVLTPGFNGDGRGMADDAEWRSFAAHNQAALLACFLKGGSYYRAGVWADIALLRALDHFAEAGGRPELAAAPLAFWGHSAGGQFNYGFACWKPGRTLAFVANKGGYYDDPAKEQTRKIPALWIAGGADTDLRIDNITSCYAENRRRGALWALAIEPGIGHGVGRSKELGMAFLEDAITLRLNAVGKLRQADPARGWFGNLQTHEVTKTVPAGKDGRLYSWLPGEASARLWKEITVE